MRLLWLAYTVCHPFLTIFWFPFPLWLALFGVGPRLMVGFAFLQPTLLPATISYHTTPSFLLQSCFASNWVGFFGPAIYSSPNGPTRPLVLMLHYYLLAGSHAPFVFPWTILAIFLTLHYHGLLLNSLGFLGPITLFIILGVHGFAIDPLLSFLSLLWVCRGSFSLFHIIYCPWFTFSLFPGSFKPIYLFKTHLFISWAYDPLFLPLELNGFSIRLPTPFYPCC